MCSELDRDEPWLWRSICTVRMQAQRLEGLADQGFPGAGFAERLRGRWRVFWMGSSGEDTLNYSNKTKASLNMAEKMETGVLGDRCGRWQLY